MNSLLTDLTELALRRGGDALGGIAVARMISEVAEELTDVLVDEARRNGCTWEQIAERLASSSQPDSRPPTPAGEVHLIRNHDGKYKALWQYLRSTTANTVTLRFSEVEHIVGATLPPSSRNHLPHWYGYKGSAVARAVIDAGWRATQVDLKAETVTFVRAQPAS